MAARAVAAEPVSDGEIAVFCERRSSTSPEAERAAEIVRCRELVRAAFEALRPESPAPAKPRSAKRRSCDLCDPFGETRPSAKRRDSSAPSRAKQPSTDLTDPF